MTELKSESGGKILISNEIIAAIAGKAAIEVEGVMSLSGLRKGKAVAVQVNGQDVRIAIALVVKMGVRLHDVAHEVQQKINSAVETMVGLNVKEVNVRVNAISYERRKK